MKRNKIKMCIWLTTIALSFAIVGCSNTKTTNNETTVQESISATETSNKSAVKTSDNTVIGSYSEDDLNTSYSETDTKIELSNGSANITGDGAIFEDGNVKITKAGTYVISGEFDGQIVTDVKDEDVVHIVLNGVNIKNTKSAAINGATGKKIVITLAEGTVNTLSNTSNYEYADGEDEPDAALFVKNNLTINGSGSLNIDSNYKAAIKAKDNLIILGGKINIDSVGKAIKGKDSVSIENADITINAEDDGITTDGAMVINSGNINITKAGEGLEGVTIDINGGNIDIVASDDGINARGLIDDSATDAQKEAYGEENQADTYLRITGGVVKVNASADGIDSNGQVYIDGGIVNISGATSGPDVALDYNGKAVITGGTFVSTGVQEMSQTFDGSSSQNFITVYYDNTVAAGSEIKVSDKDGNVVLSYTADKDFTFAVISSDKLSTGETYTVSAGENSTEVTIATGGNTVGERTSKGPGAFDKRRTGRKFSRRSAAAKAYRCKRK